MNVAPALNCWFLTGATAVGKTRIALALARRLRAEILSLDSMAVYRGMDIGTAKPTPAERALVPTHLVDLVEPSEEFSVAQYLELALAKIAEVRGRGSEVLFVGGTPLYLKCLLRGMFTGPPANWQLRQEIQAECERVGPELLHQHLAVVDPLAAAAIHPRDARRIIRALEVYRATGEPLSHQQLDFDEARPAAERHVFVLRRERSEQHQRIEQRVEAMLAAGLVDEVRGLTTDGARLGRTASQAVGYAEVLSHLAGKLDSATMIEQIKAHTRRFAKRQGTWFRSLSECRFVDLECEADAEEVAERIVSAAEQQQ